MKTILGAIALAFALSGCAQQLGPLLATVGADPAKVAEIEDKAIGTAVKPIPVYCAGPASARSMLRDRINGHENMQGNQVGVWCVGDPPLTLGD